MKNQQLVSPSRQCSSTPVTLVKDFLKKNNVTTLEHPPYSPDFAPADFYLFPRLMSALRGWRFCDANVVIKNAAEELKRLS
jgi:transposase